MEVQESTVEYPQDSTVELQESTVEVQESTVEVQESTVGAQGSTEEVHCITVEVQWDYALQECRFLLLQSNPSQGPLVSVDSSRPL